MSAASSTTTRWPHTGLHILRKPFTFLRALSEVLEEMQCLNSHNLCNAESVLRK